MTTVRLMSPRPRRGRSSNRRAVETVPLYSDVTVATKEAIDAIASATGCRKNIVIEQIIEHIPLDARGVPTWWPTSIPDQEELDLRAC